MSDRAVTTPPVEEPKPGETTEVKKPDLAPEVLSDPDEEELQEALKAVEDESKATPTPAATTTTPETPAATTPPPAEVPVAAVQDERKKRQEAEELARQSMARELYWKGVADGKFPMPGVKGDPTPTATPDQSRIKQLRGEQKALAAQVDEGKLSVAEYEEKRGVLEDEIGVVREQSTLAKSQAAPDLYLGTITAKLEEANPWIKSVPVAELLDLVPGAERDLVAAGVDFDAIRGTPMGDYRLREAVAARGIRRGFDKEYGQQTEQPAATTTPTVTAVPTDAQRKEKDDLAKRTPPVPTGTTAPANAWTAERVESMDALDLENMSAKDLKAVGDILEREAASTRVSSPTRR